MNESFVVYKQVVVKAVEERLTRLSVANKLSVYRPGLTQALQEDEISCLPPMIKEPVFIDANIIIHAASFRQADVFD